MSQYNSGGGRRLVRPRSGRMVAGVSAGLAAYLKVDTSLVRLVFGVFTVFYGLGILLYLAAWAVLPGEGEEASIAETFISKVIKPLPSAQPYPVHAQPGGRAQAE